MPVHGFVDLIAPISNVSHDFDYGTGADQAVLRMQLMSFQRTSKRIRQFESIRGFYYPQASAMLIIVIVTVSLMDLLSQYLRKLFI